jgi:hypothetical protein
LAYYFTVAKEYGVVATAGDAQVGVTGFAGAIHGTAHDCHGDPR